MEWYPYSRIGRINIAKMSTIKKKFFIKKKLNVRTTQSHLQNQYNTYENSNGITHINRKKILKFIWNDKPPQKVRQPWERTKLEASHVLSSNYITTFSPLNSMVLALKTDQWKGTESLKINPLICDHLILAREQEYSIRLEEFLQQTVLGKTG